MAYEDRKRLIEQIERLRNSRVLTYILSDRQTFPPGLPGAATNISGEPQLLFLDHLEAIGRTPKLDLFLYTRGGDTNSVWPLVSALREHCDTLSVLVPFRAHSAGTLICLGANEIVMTEAAELSPIDPTTGNQFNPSDPQNPQNRYGISVEDVAAYFKLAEERAGVAGEPSRLEVFKELTRSVHPLALGNVQRVYMQIRRLARRLLCMHLDDDEEQQSGKISQIIEALTVQFFSHVHAISRTEASKLLGDWVKSPPTDEGRAIWALFNSYAQTLELRKTFSVPDHMGDEPVRDLTVMGGFIESTQLSHVFKTGLKIVQTPILPPNIQVQIPPGAAIPLGPFASRNLEYGLRNMGWGVNDAGV